MLLLGGVAFADPNGQSRSSFVPRDDAPRPGLATLVMPAQAKSEVPPAKKDTGVRTTPAPGGGRSQDLESYIRLEPPGRERLFGTRDTEKELEERMRQERRDTQAPDLVQFPERPDYSGMAYEPRRFEPTVCFAEPAYVVYRRLYFEEKNSERYGWECGPIQPLVSTLYFFKDVALLPAHFTAYPCRRFETSAGQCWPGDPVPYYCYPPDVPLSGLLGEAAVVALIVAVIPP